MKHIKSIFFIVILAALFYSSQGQTFDWAQPIGGTDVDRTLAVMTDNQGTIYTAGHYNGRVDFDPGPDSFFKIAPRGEAYVLKMSASGQFINVITFGHTSSSYSCAVNAIKKDVSGNLYLSGYFDGTVDFDPDTSVHSIYASGKHAFYMMLDATEKLQWVKYWKYDKDAGETREEGAATAWDGSGGFLAAGQFKGKSDFDPGTAVYNLTSKANEGYILKLDGNGELLWVKQLLTDSARQEVFPLSISTDAAGNNYIAGTFFGTVDFDPDSVTSYKLNAAITCGFLLKLDPNGNFVWAKTIGGSGDPFYDRHSCRYVSTDASGNSYITGGFVDMVSCGSIDLTSAGLSDIFVAKVDASGSFVWAKQIGSLYDTEEGQRISQDASGNVFITGIYRGTTDFNPGQGVASLTSNGSVDVFILKLTSSGDFVWAKGYGGTGSSERIQAITVSGNHIYTVGKFLGSINCDPSSSSYISSAYSGSGNERHDGFIHVLNKGTTGLDDLNVLQATIYPNPARDRVTIDLGKEIVKNTTVDILDMQGRNMKRVVSDKSVIDIDITKLSKGLYLLKIQTNDKTTTKRLILE